MRTGGRIRLSVRVHANAPARVCGQAREVRGGGAENRTPVHDSPLGSISRLSHILAFGSGDTGWRACPFLAGSVFRVSIPATSYAAVPLSDVRSGDGDAHRETSLHYLGSESVIIVDV